MCHIMSSGCPWRPFHFVKKEECCEECVCSPRLFHVLCVTCTEHALNALHECGTWEEGGARVFGGRVAVHSIGMYVYCACVCHTVHVGCP